MIYEQFYEQYDLNKLNKQQLDAVKCVDRNILLLAVPGSGKTTTIINRIGYMIKVKNINPKNILTITYTKAAALEMKNRFQDKFGNEDTKFCTINSLCLAILNTFSNKKYRTINSNYKYIKNAIIEVNNNYPSENEVLYFTTIISNIKNCMYKDKDIISKYDAKILSIYNKYQNILHNSNFIDYDDQLILAYDLICNNFKILNKIQNNFPYINVDEAQDTSYIQHKIIEKLILPKGNIFMVGDEDQSIYSFRGAYPQILLNFTKVYPKSKIITIDINYRSNKEIINKANTFIKNNVSRNKKQIQQYKKAEGKAEVIDTNCMENQYNYIINKISEYQNIKQNIAILFKNNESCAPIINMFQKYNIAAKTQCNIDIFLQNVTTLDILNFIKLSINPYDKDAFMNIYYKLGLYITKNNAKFEARGNYLKYIKSIKRRNTSNVYNALAELKNQKPLDAIDTILYDIKYLKNHMNPNNYSLYKISIIKSIAKNYNTVFEFVKAVEELKNYKSNLKSNVIISTLHQSKGQEYDCVILIDNIFDVFPSYTSKKETNISIAEEDSRLFYVGMTRAKKELQIYYFNKAFNKSFGDKYSEFIERIK